jgi:hypothetical protein
VFLVRKSTTSKVEKVSICNAQTNELVVQSTKKYIFLPQPCMTKLIKIANLGGHEEGKAGKGSQVLERRNGEKRIQTLKE